MGAAPEQTVLRTAVEKGLLLARLEGLERDLDGSVERLDAMLREFHQVAQELAAIDDQLRARATLLAAASC